ncbi:hypothetical protein D7S92_31520 [Burkholderia contaminans]|nr:hypothetical protein [Burkholderia contaminans]
MTIGMGMLWATSLPAARADCLDDAANYWSVPTSLARAVAMQESGMRPRVVSKNTNGSRDIGLMGVPLIFMQFTGVGPPSCDKG